MARKKSSSRKREPLSEMAKDLIAAKAAVEGTSDEMPDPDRFPPSERPEHSPRGYEWLPDAFKRDVEPHGPDAREQVRQALAEDDFKAMLRTKIGKRYEIDPRMWDKEPLAQKVYPRFKDGWMRMRLKLYGGPYVSGWVFVPEGALTNVVNQAVESPQGVPELASQSNLKRRRGGAKPGPYYFKLKKFMEFLHEKSLEKFENGTPAELRSLVELRFERDSVLRYPKRSGLDKAIAKAKQEVIEEKAKQEVIDSADRL